LNASSPAPKAPSLREAQRALTRDRLRHGARAVFSERPYMEATIDEIALRSGVARATFYLHYDSKRALLRDLLVEDMTAHRRLYHRLADLGPKPAPADLERWIRRYMKVFSDRRAALSLFNLVIGSDPSFLAEIARERDALFDDVGARHTAFRFAQDRAGRGRRMAAHLLVFKIEQFCLHAAFVDWEADLDAGVAILVGDLATFLRG
jgi:AcrR family transcriptional regulator